jgi:hypothetical protein
VPRRHRVLPHPEAGNLVARRPAPLSRRGPRRCVRGSHRAPYLKELPSGRVPRVPMRRRAGAPNHAALTIGRRRWNAGLPRRYVCCEETRAQKDRRFDKGLPENYSAPMRPRRERNMDLATEAARSVESPDSPSLKAARRGPVRRQADNRTADLRQLVRGKEATGEG